MPVEIYREMPGLYVSRWEGVITMTEFIKAAESPVKMADEDGFEKYVYVLDLLKVTTMPFDVNNIRRLADNFASRQYSVVIGASYGVHVLAKIISRFTDYEAYFADEFDEGMEKARQRLKELETAQ